MATDLTNMSPEDIAFLVKIGQIEAPSTPPTKDKKAEE